MLSIEYTEKSASVVWDGQDLPSYNECVEFIFYALDAEDIEFEVWGNDCAGYRFIGTLGNRAVFTNYNHSMLIHTGNAKLYI